MSVNFTGKAQIMYVPPKEFKTLLDKTVIEVGRPERYHFEERRASALPMFSKDANTCSMLAVNDTLMHLAPEREDIRLFDKLSDFLKEQKDKYGDLTAVLIGGKAPNLCRPSTELYSGIANLLEKEGADYSMICGKQLDLFLDDIYKDGNNYKFTQKGNIGLEELLQEKDITPKRLKEILKYYYRDVKISRKHDLGIG
ncbi:MAG: hypothetical protein K6E29_01150 [Cyanobacteria bacterium RUI128]|nr:hypothetical protein [Cyanobacteria bacterium RUI128]